MWTKEEDEAISNHEGVSRHLWSVICKHPLLARNGRSKASIRNRYLRLEKHKAAKRGEIPWKKRCTMCGEVKMGHSCRMVDVVQHSAEERLEAAQMLGMLHANSAAGDVRIDAFGLEVEGGTLAEIGGRRSQRDKCQHGETPPNN